MDKEKEFKLNKSHDLSHVSDQTLESLIVFAKKRGYVVEDIYTTDNNDPRPYKGKTWVRARLTHWSGCTRRAYFNYPYWMWA